MPRVDLLAGGVGNKNWSYDSLFATLSSEVSCIENYTKISSLEEIKSTTNVQHENLSEASVDNRTKNQ